MSCAFYQRADKGSKQSTATVIIN